MTHIKGYFSSFPGASCMDASSCMVTSGSAEGSELERRPNPAQVRRRNCGSRGKQTQPIARPDNRPNVRQPVRPTTRPTVRPPDRPITRPPGRLSDRPSVRPSDRTAARPPGNPPDIPPARPPAVVVRDGPHQWVPHIAGLRRAMHTHASTCMGMRREYGAPSFGRRASNARCPSEG